MPIFGSRPTQQWLFENPQSLAVTISVFTQRQAQVWGAGGSHLLCHSQEQRCTRCPYRRRRSLEDPMQDMSTLRATSDAEGVPGRGGHLLASPAQPPGLKHQVTRWEDTLLYGFSESTYRTARNNTTCPQYCKNITQTSDTSQRP